MVGAAANSASIMRELNPVPFEQWHGPWSDCRQRRPVPSARGVKAVLGFVTLLPTVEMEPAPYLIAGRCAHTAAAPYVTLAPPPRPESATRPFGFLCYAEPPAEGGPPTSPRFLVEGRTACVAPNPPGHCCPALAVCHTQIDRATVPGFPRCFCWPVFVCRWVRVLVVSLCLWKIVYQKKRKKF